MPIRILFVCLGNICRSPLAEGVLRKLARDAKLDGAVEIDSAGTGTWHVGEPPDPRMIETARGHGIDLTSLRARQVRDEDFARFDLLLAMDDDNHLNLLRRCPLEHKGKVGKLRQYDPEGPGDVPDPYFGTHGFDLVYDIVHRSCVSLLDDVRGPPSPQ